LISISCEDDDNDFIPIPVILDFAPDVITLGDTINLIGGNFIPDITGNEVLFSSTLEGNTYSIDVPAEVIAAQTNILTVIVPPSVISGPITVTANGQTGTSDILNITLPNLTIVAINPPAANRGETVNITGVDFGQTIQDNTVTFGEQTATITSASSTQLEVVVPNSIAIGATTVTVAVQSTGQEASIDFEVTDNTSLTVTSYDPPAGSIGDQITIFGANFSETPANNQVSFNGIETPTLSATSNSLVVTVPSGAITGPISVTVDGETAVGPEFVIIFDFTEYVTIPGIDPTADFIRGFWLTNDIAYITGEDGILLKTIDAGENWATLSLPNTAEDIYDTFWITEMVGWVTEANGTIHRTTDGGITWMSWIDEGGIANGERLRSVVFVDENNGWVSGDNGIILKSTDGGASWSLQAAGVYPEIDFDNIYFQDTNRGWIVGEVGTILITTDGGDTWVDNTIDNLNVAEIDLKRITFTDAMNGWFAGEQLTIYKTSDGGITWEPAAISGSYFDDLNDLVVVNEQLIIAVGDDGGIARSVNGGQSFIAEVSPLTTENFDGVMASPDGNRAIAVSDLASIIK